jgi:ubiquinone biosynthesis protein
VTERVGGLTGRAGRIAFVLGRHGLRDRVERGRDGSTATRARNLRLALEELGPSFAKLGQILSTRPDLLQPEFVDELARLQDDVAPLSEAEVVGVMEAELGVPWEDVFETIEPEPLAAGTIGQVHRATLETGERVVVKVQRPTARDDILRDLRLLELFAQKVASLVTLNRVADIPTVVEHLSESLRRELDFREEATSIDRLRSGLEPFTRLGAPAVFHQFSTERLLVLEEIQGVPLREAPPGPESKEAARQLLESYYRQILVDGFFHADPHPGNLLWWNDRIYFLDFGMVGEVEPHVRELVLLLLLAFWREDASFLAEIVVSLSDTSAPPDLDVAALEHDLDALIGHFRHASLSELEIGPLLQAIVTTCSRHGLRLPAALALTGKALAQVQLAVAELDPDLDPLAPVAPLVVRMLARRVRTTADPKQLFYEVQKLGIRARRLVEAFERMVGARPGPRLQVEFRSATMEDTIRMASRRLALAFAGGTAFVAAGLTAASSHVAAWVPALFGAVGGALTFGLVWDLVRSRSGRAGGAG